MRRRQPPEEPEERRTDTWRDFYDPDEPVDGKTDEDKFTARAARAFRRWKNARSTR